MKNKENPFPDQPGNLVSIGIKLFEEIPFCIGIVRYRQSYSYEEVVCPETKVSQNI